MHFYLSITLIVLAITMSLKTLFVPQKIKGKQVSLENFITLALIYATVMAGFGLLYYLLDLKGTWVLSDVSMRPSTSSYERMSTSMYFSAITLFSVGYGDIAPVGVGRVIAVIEALVGYTIPAAFVTRAVFDQKRS
ncbi:ion channel [Mesobacillus subterraneus]|jgi:potassium channel LctB|uniref:potassium channel family protein n=1 Tax=Mesobacillus subterraneus TaxID=285983 RepID=UPI0020407629|nr:potassium channel family protein [Mesobacillus subterraneus]MCM3667028.1 ion channel [Mesobacillus subterraneus]MCM3685052.1 ion channel [Mesobacillus subterraneus]